MSLFEDDPQDLQLDALLTALGRAPAPSGLEDRILKRLAAGPERARRLRPIWLWVTGGVVAAALLGSVALRPGVLDLARAKTAKATADPSASLRNDNNLRDVGKGRDDGSLRDDSSLRDDLKEMAARGRPTSGPERQAQGPRGLILTPGLQAASTLPIAKAATEAELNQPAPPMPLTDQEKLLLRIARRNDPDQMAGLVPANRELETLLDHAEYETFFAPPPPLDQAVTQQVQVNDNWHPAH